MFDYIAWIRFGTSAGLPLKILVTRARMRRAAWIRADSKLVALVVLPLVISGCGTRIFNSGQATKSASPPSSTPTLSINSSSVTYGDVRVDTAATQSLTLSSTGTAAVTVTAATVSGPGFSLEASSLPFTLNPGDTANLAVKFDPSDAGPASGQLTLSSNSSTGGSVAVKLSGTGTLPVVELTWDDANSGDVNAGYNIYRAQGSDSGFELLEKSNAERSFVDSNVKTRQTYFYYVTSLDSFGSESAPSEIASVTIP